MLNKVAGEGFIRWSICGNDGQLITLELPGYHIPKAEVRLLSPQVLPGLVGGESAQTATDRKIRLGNGITLMEKYCPRSRPSLLDVTNTMV